MEQQNKLTVRNLRISFRTSNGKVQAVRGIDFDLKEGETLAIVGESGSGKSVTSKAILGILAGNSIVEGGEIIYDGKDLLKITEDDFHRLRGDKIAMIFQDPMSSLNPIVRIGKQLTEAMILKGKVRQRESRKAFNSYLALLNRFMIEALANGDAAKAAALTQKCKDFDRFEYKHLELESAYNTAHESAVEAVEDLNVLLLEMEKRAAKDVTYRVGRVLRLAKNAVQEYVVKEDAERLLALVEAVPADLAAAKQEKDASYAAVAEKLTEVRGILETAVAFPKPNFFAMGYFLTFGEEPMPELPVDELNVYLRKYLDEHFMLDFIANTKEALIYVNKLSCEKAEEAVRVLREKRAAFEAELLEKQTCKEALAAMSQAVLDAINHLELTKDSLSYTFTLGMRSALEAYFKAIKHNQKEEARFARQQAKYDRLVARGKEPNGKVIPAAVTDLIQARDGMLHQIDRLAKHLEQRNADYAERNYESDPVAVIDYLKANASGVVNRVTKRMAKDKAIKLMEEVGIAEPRKRYNQYPFEFSGGMRQRIVIAIALAANPDILICDEPTTALDVTIQSQILELINRLKEERHLSVIFITHDLGVVANMADRVAVMYAGKIVEYGTAEDIFYHAAHPYTWALLSSMPDLDTNEKLDAIPGTPPNMIYPPVGDAFAERNKYALKIDFEQQPPMFRVSDTHYAATWLLHPNAPHVDPPKVVTDRIARMKERRNTYAAGKDSANN